MTFTLNFIVIIILMALATASVSLTITRSKLFHPLRLWVDKKTGPTFSELINCPYCTSHYVALFFTSGLYSMDPSFKIIAYVMICFAIVTLAALFMKPVYQAIESLD